jgi:hypothetical protein
MHPEASVWTAHCRDETLRRTKRIRTLGPPSGKRRFRDSPFRLCGTPLIRRKNRLVLQEGPAVRIPFPPPASLVAG